MNEEQKAFIRGYVAALIRVIEHEGYASAVAHELFNWRLEGKISLAEEAGCPAYEISELKKWFS